MAKNPQLQRFICPRCQRTKATDKVHVECEYCAEEMVSMVIWVRRQVRANKPGKPEKEKDE